MLQTRRKLGRHAPMVRRDSTRRGIQCRATCTRRRREGGRGGQRTGCTSLKPKRGAEEGAATVAGAAIVAQRRERRRKGRGEQGGARGASSRGSRPAEGQQASPRVTRGGKNTAASTKQESDRKAGWRRRDSRATAKRPAGTRRSELSRLGGKAAAEGYWRKSGAHLSLWREAQRGAGRGARTRERAEGCSKGRQRHAAGKCHTSGFPEHREREERRKRQEAGPAGPSAQENQSEKRGRGERQAGEDRRRRGGGRRARRHSRAHLAASLAMCNVAGGRCPVRWPFWHPSERRGGETEEAERGARGGGRRSERKSEKRAAQREGEQGGRRSGEGGGQGDAGGEGREEGAKRARGGEEQGASGEGGEEEGEAEERQRGQRRRPNCKPIMILGQAT